PTHGSVATKPIRAASACGPLKRRGRRALMPQRFARKGVCRLSGERFTALLAGRPVPMTGGRGDGGDDRRHPVVVRAVEDNAPVDAFLRPNADDEHRERVPFVDGVADVRLRAEGPFVLGNTIGDGLPGCATAVDLLGVDRRQRVANDSSNGRFHCWCLFLSWVVDELSALAVDGLAAARAVLDHLAEAHPRILDVTEGQNGLVAPLARRQVAREGPDRVLDAFQLSPEAVAKLVFVQGLQAFKKGVPLAFVRRHLAVSGVESFAGELLGAGVTDVRAYGVGVHVDLCVGIVHCWVSVACWVLVVDEPTTLR